jgi:hypothetical protein
MYAIYGNIYHQYTPNVSIYTSRILWDIPSHLIVETVETVAAEGLERLQVTLRFPRLMSPQPIFLMGK